ncbi:MAG: hypothetical protein U0936_06305 [Planctomycetaceae bacterium]
MFRSACFPETVTFFRKPSVDRQGSAGHSTADLDPDRTMSVMTIYDDDTPGLQVIEMGNTRLCQRAMKQLSRWR